MKCPGRFSGVPVMNFSTITANLNIDNNEQKAEQALMIWISKYSNACGIDTTNPICPRFIMTCDNIEEYRQAIDEFGELWIHFNDRGLDETTFMSAYSVARQKTQENE